MPERQIPWRKVAERLSGEFRVKTTFRNSYFHLNARVTGVRIAVIAESRPYSPTGGRTEIRAYAEKAFGATVCVLRDLGSVPLHRRVFLRDVLVGDVDFDDLWVINAKREAQAQAFLGPEVRARIGAVPPSTTSYSHYVDGVSSMYYDFDLRGRDVMANSPNFEKDPDRMVAAIEAAVALVQQPQRLVSTWKKLAAELDGRLEIKKRWRFDGSTLIRFPVQGSRVTVFPLAIKLGWRRDRLRTRVSCECSGEQLLGRFSLEAGQSLDLGAALAERIGHAMMDSGALSLSGNGRQIHADMDGNVTDPQRIRAAASAVAILARGKDAHAGPYR